MIPPCSERKPMSLCNKLHGSTITSSPATSPHRFPRCASNTPSSSLRASPLALPSAWNSPPLDSMSLTPQLPRVNTEMSLWQRPFPTALIEASAARRHPHSASQHLRLLLVLSPEVRPTRSGLCLFSSLAMSLVPDLLLLLNKHLL